MNSIKRVAKALVGAGVAGLGVIFASMDDGLTGSEWAKAGVALLIALGGVWAIPNKPPAEPVGE